MEVVDEAELVPVLLDGVGPTAIGDCGGDLFFHRFKGEEFGWFDGGDLEDVPAEFGSRKCGGVDREGERMGGEVSGEASLTHPAEIASFCFASFVFADGGGETGKVDFSCLE